MPDAVGLGFLTVKRLLNHTFQGGVTGGYIVQGFNPTKERVHFQKVCDYILDCKSAYLGKRAVQVNEREALIQFKRLALELGLDPMMAFEALSKEQVDAAA